MGFCTHGKREAMRAFTDKDVMPLGTFKGRRLEVVPAWHLIWLRSQTWFVNSNRTDYMRLRLYIDENMDALDKEYARNKKGKGIK